MIRKSRVVVLVVAAVAAGVLLTAGFNFSPIARAFWGDKEKPAVVNISTTQVVKLGHPRMRNPFGPQDPFEEAGFEEGDIVRQVNRRPVSNRAEYTKLAAKAKGGKTTMFLVERGDPASS